MLPQKELLALFTYQNGELFWRVSLRKGIKGHRAGTVNASGYRQVCIRRKIYLEHRIIYAMYYGSVPTMLDHINGDRADNRIENLRPCTQQENNYNTPGWSKKKTPKGVTWAAKDNRWQAQISINGKNTYLGQFKTIEEAEAKVNAVRKAKHGKFARSSI